MFKEVLLVLSCTCVCARADETQCSTSAMSIRVNSHRNQTGHWISQVSVIQEMAKNENSNKSEPWLINIDQRTTLCETNKISLETKFLLTVPPASTQTALNAQRGPDPPICTQATPDAPREPDPPSTQTPLKALKVPPKGYELFPGVGHYKFHIEPLTWPLANQSCAEEGAHLAIINSEKESDVMKTLFARYPTIIGASDNNNAWIGLQRIGKNYFTIFGVPVEKTGFQRWYGSEPDDVHNCGLVYRPDGALADFTCDWRVAYVCEYDL